MANSAFKPGDKVTRAGTAGPYGIVQRVRIDTQRPSLKESAVGQEPPGVTVSVLWDNGTTSHFVPDGLQIAG